MTMMTGTLLRLSLVVGVLAVVPASLIAGPADDTLAEQLVREDPAALAAAVEQDGDPAAGANVFHARQLVCTQCHAAGEGESPLGPNLAAWPEGVARDRLIP
ncbi:MAG: hypothetical protein O3C39_01495, partial [Planctomycetota bacterium]|nr:hypothetical protein [Planctomycetota bacterium]